MGRFIIIALIVLFALIGLAAQWPLAWLKVAGGDRLPPGLTLTGTVWDGQVSGYPGLGPVNVQTRPLKALTGQPWIIFDGASPARLQGQASPGRVNDLRFSAQLQTLPLIDGRLVGLRGDLRVDIDTLAFTGAQCTAASGQAWTNVLASNRSAWRWEGPALEGPISCQNGQLTVNLQGSDAENSISAQLTFQTNGNYVAEILAESRDPDADLLLPVMGFERDGTGFRLVEQGRWM